VKTVSNQTVSAEYVRLFLAVKKSLLFLQLDKNAIAKTSINAATMPLSFPMI
jgi:hypothetical protein